MLPSGAVTILPRPALLVGTGNTLTAACAGVVPVTTRSGPTSNVSAVSRARRARAIGRVTSVRGGAIPPWSRVPPSRPPHQQARCPSQRPTDELSPRILPSRRGSHDDDRGRGSYGGAGAAGGSLGPHRGLVGARRVRARLHRRSRAR